VLFLLPSIGVGPGGTVTIDKKEVPVGNAKDLVFKELPIIVINLPQKVYIVPLPKGLISCRRNFFQIDYKTRIVSLLIMTCHFPLALGELGKYFFRKHWELPL